MLRTQSEQLNAILIALGGKPLRLPPDIGDEFVSDYLAIASYEPADEFDEADEDEIDPEGMDMAVQLGVVTKNGGL